MKKKTIIIAIILAIILSISAIPASAASNLSANPTASTVYVNGAAKAFEAYNIGGNNYFKLRDLAYALNGTAKQFEVGYDNATKAITLTTGRAYTPDGGEMARGDGRAKTASPTASRIYLDGRELNLTVSLIGGNNFFKLRDLMEAIDVFVGYDNATKAITLDTSKSYVPEGTTAPTTTPSGGLNAEEQELVGTWSGYYKGFSLYYEFRADGTYSYVTQQDTAMPGHSNWSIWVGRWNRTGNIVSLSQIKYTGWYGRSDCVDALVLNATKPYRINSYGELPWTDVSNDTMSIEMREPDSSFVRRYFINHSVADPTDGYSPRLESNQLPDWLYLGK